MAQGNRKLDALADVLERAGDDPVRLDVVRRAQNFKRSWVELAEALSKLRDSRAYLGWGYGDLHEYCQKELHIKAVTVDKLLLSYGTLSRHAPEVLARDGVQRPIPSVEAIDYFTRAVGDNELDASKKRRVDAPAQVLDELRNAVFDEGRSATQLRQHFNPLLYPKPQQGEDEAALRRVRDAARKLNEQVSQVDGLSQARVARVDAALSALIRDLDQLMEQGKARAHKMAKKATRRKPAASERQARRRTRD